MKSFELIKKAVTVITLIILTADILLEVNLFPYALIGFGTYCILKSKEYYDNEKKPMFICSLAAGVLIILAVIAMIIKMN